MIRLAEPADLLTVKALAERCGSALQKQGIFQWDNHYPSRQRLAEDIARKHLYLKKWKDTIVGMLVMKEEMDPVYNSIAWQVPGHRALYVHRLATDPDSWGQGLGRQLMDFAEDFASQDGLMAVRLDTYSKNPRNIRFYEHRGYQRVGQVFFPEKNPHPYFCYEKPISG